MRRVLFWSQMDATDTLRPGLIESRRHIVFAWSVFIAALVITCFCLAPLLYPGRQPLAFFPDNVQEELFFDCFAVSGGCWLACWVAALNNWKVATKIAQWLGIILLSLNQALLLGVWYELCSRPHALEHGMWAVPWLIQSYLIGCFVGFFTMPLLTLSGNRSLTGLGSLALILPWLVGRKEVLMGAHVLHGVFVEWSRALGG